MRSNTKPRYAEQTHEGAPAFPHLTPEQRLRRSVMSCLLFEDEFYEDGVAIAERIAEAAAEVPTATLAALAVEARSKFNLRHVPLLLLCILARAGAGSALVGDTIAETIQRPDELAEFLALYWKGGKRPLAAQAKKGLAKAFRKFSAYSLAKYNRDNAIRLRDVLFLVHAKPKDAEQAETWRKLVDGSLEAPDTWEVALSAGADKRATWERLLTEGKLGYLALLRNLRNMQEAKVEPRLVRNALIARKGAERVFPFRYVAACRAAPQFAQPLDSALQAAIAESPQLPGMTAVLVDISGSMNDKLSARSDLTRADAAAALAAIIPAEQIRVFSFSDNVCEVPPYRGLAGIDAILNSQPRNGTRLFDAVRLVNENVQYDRLIVVTDEQSHPATQQLGWGNREQSQLSRTCPDPLGRGYMINVASARNGVGYGKWLHLDGFSEQVIRFIAEHEAASRQ